MGNYYKIFDNKSKEWNRNQEYNLMFIKTVQNYLNDVLTCRGHVLLNDVYDRLGFERTSEGCIVGWLNAEEKKFIDFNTKLKDDVITLDFNVDGIIYDKI